MQEYSLELKDKKEIAKGTKTFIFVKPQSFEYKPGDFMYWTLPQLNYPDQRGNMRHFSFSSSPTEINLAFTCRIREESGYKKTLDEMAIGDIILARGPSGILNMEDGVTNPQVFLAGGIGITPFRSRIKYVTDNNLNTEILLLYSNSHTEEISFKEEFDKLAAEHSNFKVEYVVSDPVGSKLSWTGRVGRISADFIQKLTDLKISTFWVCGPPPMVSAMEEILSDLQVLKERIKTEKFTGY